MQGSNGVVVGGACGMKCQQALRFKRVAVGCLLGMLNVPRCWFWFATKKKKKEPKKKKK